MVGNDHMSARFVWRTRSPKKLKQKLLVLTKAVYFRVHNVFSWIVKAIHTSFKIGTNTVHTFCYLLFFILVINFGNSIQSFISHFNNSRTFWKKYLEVALIYPTSTVPHPFITTKLSIFTRRFLTDEPHNSSNLSLKICSWVVNPFMALSTTIFSCLSTYWKTIIRPVLVSFSSGWHWPVPTM